MEVIRALKVKNQSKLQLSLVLSMAGDACGPASKGAWVHPGLEQIGLPNGSFKSGPSASMGTLMIALR